MHLTLFYILLRNRLHTKHYSDLKRDIDMKEELSKHFQRSSNQSTGQTNTFHSWIFFFESSFFFLLSWPWDMLLWSVTHLDAAIFINAVMFLWSSQRQTHFGSLVLDQANHLSSYFCTWPPLSNTRLHSSLCPTQHLWLARLLPSQLSSSPSVLIKVIDLPKSCLFQQLGFFFSRTYYSQNVNVWGTQMLWNIIRCI